MARQAVVKTEQEFADWATRAGMPAGEARALRQAFESASPTATAAFVIRREGELLRFAWDVVVVEAAKLRALR